MILGARLEAASLSDPHVRLQPPRFVYPRFRETTATAIEAVRGGLAYFGVVVVIPFGSDQKSEKSSPARRLRRPPDS